MKPPACCIAYRDLATQDFTIGAWAILVGLEQVISERVSELLEEGKRLKEEEEEADRAKKEAATRKRKVVAKDGGGAAGKE